jgi:hypothetical protein
MDLLPFFVSLESFASTKNRTAAEINVSAATPIKYFFIILFPFRISRRPHGIARRESYHLSLL